MNTIQQWIHNRTHDKEQQLITCKQCKTTQKKANNWDHQQCQKCNNLIYDYRY